MDPELRARVKEFQLKATLAGGLLFVGSALAAAYIAFFRATDRLPSFLIWLGRLLGGR